VKFGDGRPVDVSVRAQGNAAEVSVRDHGVGISADRLPSIFQPFERAAKKEHFGGVGLGLYNAKAIVVAHGGAIDVTTEQGNGSTFVVRLPLAPCPASG
jgi:signal transduction histidine kinase